jgi:hypothetical protein
MPAAELDAIRAQAAAFRRALEHDPDVTPA